jgi:hypothetical protein
VLKYQKYEHMNTDDRRIADLKDELRQRDARISELKDESDEQRDQIQRLAARVQEYDEAIEAWKHCFEMVPNEAGVWVWSRSFVEGDEWYEKYSSLLKKWNTFIAEYNGLIRKRNVGRPLAASETQCATVRRLHKAGKSLRDIADETNLGLSTVRTIVGQINGTDRTTLKHLTRIDPERARAKVWKSKLQQRNALPQRIHELQKNGARLLKEVKGIGAGRVAA